LKSGLFGFLFAMWILIIAGGGIVVTLLGPISITGFGELDWFISSIIKAIIAIVLVVIWILILSKLKNMIFRKEIKS
jgi:amino acid permease